MKKILLCLVIPLLMIGCKGNNTSTSTADSSYTYVDDYGSTTRVPAHPKRIVSASPAITEIIFELGAEKRLVGRTDFCTYPPQAAKIESIGGISNLNIEKILSLKPDLVLSGSMIPQQSVATMNKLGSPMVCIIEQPHFDSLYSNIGKVGRLIGCQKEAAALNQRLRQRMKVVQNSLDSNMKENERPKMYYVVGFGKGGNFTAGGNTFINDIIRMAGGRNIAQDIQGWSISMEALFHADPDYIIIRKEDKDAFVRMPPYNRLRAVKQGHLIPIESSLIDVQTPRNIEAVELLHNAIKSKQ